MLQSLLLVGLGGVLAIAGTATGQYLQSRHTRRLRIDEYAREDRYRLFRDRLEAYREYHVAVGNARRVMGLHNRSVDDADLHEMLKEARAEAWRAYTLVWLIGEERVVNAASVLLDMVDSVTWHGARFEPDSWREEIQAFVGAARSDLLPENGSSNSMV